MVKPIKTLYIEENGEKKIYREHELNLNALGGVDRQKLFNNSERLRRGIKGELVFCVPDESKDDIKRLLKPKRKIKGFFKKVKEDKNES